MRMPIAAGIDALTGEPLPALDPADIEALRPGARATGPSAAAPSRPGRTRSVMQPRVSQTDPNDLTHTGWGILFGATIPARVREALQPLIDHRRAQTDERLFKIFEGPTAVRQGETARQWVERLGASLQIVDPTLGIPYYLLIVASPEDVPFDFQYVLDSHWGAGRLFFDTADQYRQYALSVIASESGARRRARQLALFATAHDGDAATDAFTTFVADPLVTGTTDIPRIGLPQRFELAPYMRDEATRQALTDIYRGEVAGGPPAILFSGTHGLAYPHDDPRLPALQGALLCQDWVGGPPREGDRLAAADLPADADVQGMIHLLFACYGVGCPEVDTFKRGSPPRRIAPHAMVARLPQALLSHPNGGALAVIGHVDRAWAHSFATNGRGPQIQGFRDVLAKLMTGTRAGHAMDQFNQRWTALSADLQEMLAAPADQALAAEDIASCWVARDDARNYMLFGDPAVRINA